MENAAGASLSDSEPKSNTSEELLLAPPAGLGDTGALWWVPGDSTRSEGPSLLCSHRLMSAAAEDIITPDGPSSLSSAANGCTSVPVTDETQ